MNKHILNWWMGGGIPIQTEYTTLLNRATALGYTHPSAAQQVKQNTLIYNLKLLGIWNSLDVFYVFATDGDRNFAKLNWTAPSFYACTEVNTPTFTTNVGFNGDGSTSYLNANWIPGTLGINYTTNSASFGGYVNTEGAETKVVFGGYGSNAHTIYLIPRRATGDNYAQILINHQTPVYAPADSPLLAKKFWHVQRTASNSLRVWHNGTSSTAASTASTGGPNGNVFIGARNANGVADLHSNKQIGCFFAGASLSGLEASFYNAWNTYFTSL